MIGQACENTVIQSVGTTTVLFRKGGHKSVKAPTQSDAMQYPNNKHYLCQVCDLTVYRELSMSLYIF